MVRCAVAPGRCGTTPILARNSSGSRSRFRSIGCRRAGSGRSRQAVRQRRERTLPGGLNGRSAGLPAALGARLPELGCEGVQRLLHGLDPIGVLGLETCPRSSRRVDLAILLGRVPAPRLLGPPQALLRSADPELERPQPCEILASGRQVVLDVGEEVRDLRHAPVREPLPDHAEGFLEERLGPRGEHLDVHVEGDPFRQLKTPAGRQCLQRRDYLGRMPGGKGGLRLRDRRWERRSDVGDAFSWQVDARLVAPGIGEGKRPPQRGFGQRGRSRGRLPDGDCGLRRGRTGGRLRRKLGGGSHGRFPL